MALVAVVAITATAVHLKVRTVDVDDGTIMDPVNYVFCFGVLKLFLFGICWDLVIH